MKILVIEDNPRLADKIQTQLQKWFIIEVANSGDAGLQLLPKTEFDCVVLDLGLPDAPGSEICLRIRQMEKRPAMPGVFHSRERALRVRGDRPRS